jgi:hypothetical protein
MVTTPLVIPLTIPEVSTVAIESLALIHVPPATESISVIVFASQTLPTPVIVPALGTVFTVKGAAIKITPQPFVSE